MKKSFRKTTFLSALAIAVPAMGMAQDKVEASAGADLVSGYIWRGQDLGGVSIQPTLSVSYKGFSLSAWGTASIEKEDTKEIDLTLGYATGGFSISVTDYWFNGGRIGSVSSVIHSVGSGEIGIPVQGQRSEVITYLCLEGMVGIV